MKPDLNKIKIIILDVDGTMTDGQISFDNNGIETKSFNVKDGMAISKAIKDGIKVAIITGRTSKIVEKHFLSPLTYHDMICFSPLETDMGVKDVFFTGCFFSGPP